MDCEPRTSGLLITSDSSVAMTSTRIGHGTKPAIVESQFMLATSLPSKRPPLVLDRLLDPVGRCLTPRSARALLKLQADSDLQSHIEDLARKSTAGRLTGEERSEYEALVAAGTVISILKSKARVVLAKASGSRG